MRPRARRLLAALFAAAPVVLGLACYHHGDLPAPAAKTIDGNAEVDAAWVNDFAGRVKAAQAQLGPCKDDDCVCTVLCELKATPPPKGPVEVTFPGKISGVGVQVDAKGKVIKCFYNSSDDGVSEIDDCPWKND